MQTAPALERVARECVEDLAADGVVYAEVRFAPEQHLADGLTLDEVVESVLSGFAKGEVDAAGQGRPIVVRCLVTAMRHAARSREIAELAVRFRDRGSRLRHRRAEAGNPPTRHLDAFEYMRANNARFTIHAGEAFGLPPIHEALALLRLRPARARRPGHRRHHAAAGGECGGTLVRGCGARRHRGDGTRQADSAGAVPEFQRADRCRGVIGRAPVQYPCATAVPGHGEHR